MDEIRRFIRWTVPGTIAVLWTAVLSSLPTLVAGFGRRGTPLPDLDHVTGAEAALLAVVGLAVGVAIDSIAHVIPSIVLRGGLVRWDMPGEVLRLPQVITRARRLKPDFPDADLLASAKGPFRRTADPATGHLQVYRLTTVLPYARVPRDIRRQWRDQVEANAGLLKDVLATLTSDVGKEMNAKYLSLTDRYRSMGSCRVAVALSGVLAELRIVGYRAMSESITDLLVSAVLAAVITMIMIGFFSKQRAELLQQRRRVVVHRFALAIQGERSVDADTGGPSSDHTSQPPPSTAT